MKTTAKTKKASATKAPVKATKTSSKSPVKSTKTVAKTTAKAVAKAKPAVKTSKVAVKKAAAPAKTVKSAAKKPVAAAKTPAKAVKPAAKAVKTVKSAPKAAPKAVKAVKTPVKAVAKAAPKVVAAVKVKEVAKKAVVKAVAPVKAAPAVSASKPIIVSMPLNQNNAPVRTPTPVVMAVRPASVTTNKIDTAATPRPVYHPIQVINKPLTPAQTARPMAPVAKADEKVEFKKGDYVVYPAHGVGEIEAVETQIIGGMEIKLYAIMFEKDRMRLKVPVFKAHASGLRRLSTTNRMQDALKTLQGRAQVRRAMWSRRAQEYETKINSGDPVSIAEVLRDLKRSNDESEQSYSERQIYQSALERLAREVAAVEKISEIEAAERLENMIRGKRARAAAEAAVVKEAANA